MGISPRATDRRALLPLSRASLFTLGAALLLGAGACGTTETQAPHVPDQAVKPGPKPVDPDEPRLTLKGESVLVDGEPSGTVSDALKEGRPIHIDPLRRALEKQKAAWESKNPGKEFPARCRLDLEADAPDAVWRSVVMTAFFAGHKRMTLESAGGEVLIRAAIPLPPERGGPQRPLMIAVRTDSFDALWLSPKDAGKQKAAPRPAAPATGPVELPALADVLKKECGSTAAPCFDVVSLRSNAPLAFGELLGVVRAIKPVWAVAEPAPLFDFMRGTSLVGLPEGFSGSNSGGTGRIEPSEVKRVVKANFNKFTACYQQGLKRDATLKGRVAVQFVIEPEGNVSDAVSIAKAPGPGSGGAAELVTTLPDKKVVGCILDEYRKLVFPKPQGGRVTVVYPIDLEAN